MTVRTSTDVVALGTVLGVWAHPDDEVYLSGGLMAAAVAAGQRVVVVTATRGEAGTDDPQRWPPARLAQLRSEELAASLAVLGGGRGRIEHRYLGARAPSFRYIDGCLTRYPAAPAVEELATIMSEIGPDSVLTFGPDGITGHPDHRTVSSWADDAFRLWANTGSRLLHATYTNDTAQPFVDVLSPMDDGDDVPPISPRSQLVIDLCLRHEPETLDTKVSALRAQASQTGSLEQMLGARYRDFVSGEQFREARREARP